MTVLAQNTAEGGTAGAAVAAGGSGSGSPWDAVVNVGGVITYDNAHVDVGAVAYKVAMLTASCRLEWNATTLGAGTLTDLYFANDFYFTGSPTSSCHLVEGVTNTAAQAWAIDIASTGKLFIRNGANANIYTSSMNLPVNTWCRIEAHVVHNGATGTIQVRIFTSYTDTSPAEDSGVLTSNLAADTSRLYLGAFTSSTALPAYWFGEPRVGNTAASGTWLGPPAAGQAAAAADQVGVTDSAAAAAGRSRSAADPVAITEAVTAVLSTAGASAVADQVAIAEAVTAAWSRSATAADTLSVTDAVTTSTPVISALATVNPVWVAHRGGFAATLGEGTLEAYTAAADQNSKAFLETSVWRCSTGEYVISHDRTTARVFSGTSLDITTATWSTLSTKTTLIGGNPIRRLTDVLGALPGRLFVVDNKQDVNHAALIAVLDAQAPGRWMGKATWTAHPTWLTACQNAGAPVWAFFYPADVQGATPTASMSTVLGSLTKAKSPVIFGLGDYSAAPVPVQSDADTFLGFIISNGLLCWADIINTTAQRANADTQATTAGRPFDGYMTSGFAAVAPTDQPAPADLVGVSDAAVAAADRTRSPADPVGVSDAAVSAADRNRSPADLVGVTDVTVAAADRTRSPADQVAITDVAVAAADRTGAPTELVAITDVAVAAADLSRAPADLLGVTDGAVAAADRSRAPADQVAISDALVIESSLERGANDQVTGVDTVATTAGRDRATADAVAIDELVQSARAAATMLTEHLGITDALSTSVDAARALSDQVSVAEAVTTVLTQAGSGGDLTVHASLAPRRWRATLGHRRHSATLGAQP